MLKVQILALKDMLKKSKIKFKIDLFKWGNDMAWVSHKHATLSHVKDFQTMDKLKR